MSPVILLLIGMIIVLGGILVLRLHPVLALLAGALIVAGFTSDISLQTYALDKGMSGAEMDAFLNQSLGQRVALAFGNTCGRIGILIALASVIGKSLLESGAAERIVRWMVRLLGEKRAPFSFLSSSYLLAIPVYFDTVFYLMIPLARAMGIRKKNQYPLYVMGIIAGGVMAHSLVPPTPGPLFVAGELEVSLGLMIIMGFIVGLVCSFGGLLYSNWLNMRQNIPLRDTADATIEDLEKWTSRERSNLPPLLWSVFPILLPVILIAGDTITSLSPDLPSWILYFFNIFGDPVVALSLATAVALYLILKHFRFVLKNIQKPIQDSIYSAGVIILITASGGAFGAMLQQTAIGSVIAEWAPNYQLAVLPLAFVITAVVRTAQGSATVAMITAVGILGAFNSDILGFHPVYLALVIGCGSKIFPWMNDSGFWIVCKMSGFTEKETFRNFSFLLTVMGIVGLIATVILARIFPLI
jgi:GntP family gluconate:H+ symporter